MPGLSASQGILGWWQADRKSAAEQATPQVEHQRRGTPGATWVHDRLSCCCYVVVIPTHPHARINNNKTFYIYIYIIYIYSNSILQ